MKTRAVIFDWAGTMIDFGSFAPMDVFVQAFAEFGVAVTVAEARAPMGSPKWDHIRAMMDAPRIAAAWQEVHGTPPTDADVDCVYEVFVPMNAAVVADHADLVPGAAETVAWLRARGVAIGSTTGYTRAIMERVLPRAAAQGYAPDCLVCADDLPETRPGPLAIYQCLIALRAYPPAAVIKVDDTPPGLAEGVAAGCVTVGVALSGNLVGLTAEALDALDAPARDAHRRRATAILREAGADHVIDTVRDLPALVERLERAGAAGPGGQPVRRPPRRPARSAP